MSPAPAITDPARELLRLASLRSGVDLAKASGQDASAKTKSTVDPATYYDPNDVLRIGQTILRKHASHIRSDLERYALYEQLFVAALDTGDIETAKGFLAKIQKRFPGKSSVRVQRLVGMLAEAEGDDEEAIRIYEATLADDEANFAIRKRLVAVYWSSNQREKAIASLVELVDTAAQDVEAWTELARMYLCENMYQQAAFCMEELMLLKPYNHLLQIRYADLMKTMGRDELAVKYYCSALEIAPDHIRALYGLRLVTTALITKLQKSTGAGSAGGKGSSKKEVAVAGMSEDIEPPSLEILTALNDLTAVRIAKLYKDVATEKSKVKGAVEMQSVVAAWIDQSRVVSA
ncbi:ER membrane complex subunit 2 [Irineochytrium annulatum]|nr:ER membrane complex subunit 2 [Irineochytrium annulatum]